MPIKAEGQAITDLTYLFTKVDLNELFSGNPVKINKELQRTLDASEQYINDKDTVIFASSTLKRILTIFVNSKKQLDVKYFDLITNYIKRVWDYPADIVCYESADIFSLLLLIHLRQCEECLQRKPHETAANCDWINEQSQWLLVDPSLCKTRFKCLAQLVTTCPTLSSSLTPSFFNNHYELLNDTHLANVICELIIINLLDTTENWHAHEQSILQFVQRFEPFVIKQRLIKMMEKKPELQKFLETSICGMRANKLNSKEYDLMLEMCRSLINSQKSKGKNDPVMTWSDLLPHETMAEAIVHVDLEVRVSAWKLIVEHPKTTLQFTEVDIDLMRIFLDSNMTCQSSGARQNIVSTLKTVLARMGESCEMIVKRNNEDDMNLYDMYIDFVKAIARSAFDSLSPKANFYRRMMALCQIEALYTKENYIANKKSRFVEKMNLDITLGSERLDLIIGCLEDSYDLVQSTALRILKTLDFGAVVLNEDVYLRISSGLMYSLRNRSNMASGYRMQYFLFRHPDRLQPLLSKFVEECENDIRTSETDLMNITSSPVHPVLNTIELLIQSSGLNTKKDRSEEEMDWWRSFMSEKLLPICHRIIKVVTPVVFDISPEGFIPDEKLAEMEGMATDAQAELSQHLLVCCWRAHKHISGIFAWCIKVLAPLNVLSPSEVTEIGSFYWNQLTECKHRGAFETAVEGFTQMCKFLWISDHPDHPKPARWLLEILDAIRGSRDFLNLCSTRRSAGLPHLVVAIVATEPEVYKGEALRYAIESLLDMDGKDEEHRIHSLNVMKSIILSSALSSKVPFCLEETLSVSIRACSADWSERNSGSQLFAALRVRIFGVSRSVQRSLNVDAKNRQSGYEFFSKFPSLYRFLFDQLNGDLDSFPLLPPLVLLTHLHSPSSTSSVYPLRPFVPPLIKIALYAKRENVRAHAVAAILAIADSDTIEDLCLWVEQFDYNNARQNHVHTYLMLMDGLYDIISDKRRMRWVAEKIVLSLAFKKWCDFNVNMYLTMANNWNIEYDVDEIDKDTICLSKRPIAYKLTIDADAFKTEMSIFLRDPEVRREVYRSIQKNGWNSCNKYVCAYFVSMAVQDLSDASLPQSDAKRILSILAKGCNRMNVDIRTKLQQFVRERLEDFDSTWNLESTKSCALQVLYMHVEDASQIDDTLISWIRNCFETEDVEAKQIALDMGCRLIDSLVVDSVSSQSFTAIQNKLIASVALYLQDEDQDIRSQASSSLSRLVYTWKRAPLNPELCRLLVARWVLMVPTDGSLTGRSSADSQEDETEETMEPDERDELFDACAANSFAEDAYFGNFQLYETILGVRGNSEVFSMDMD